MRKESPFVYRKKPAYLYPGRNSVDNPIIIPALLVLFSLPFVTRLTIAPTKYLKCNNLILIVSIYKIINMFLFIIIPTITS